MKRNIIIRGLAAAAVVLGMASCADDYLDLKPITSVTSDTVSSSVEGARQGMYGICNAMYMQYGRFDSYFFSGEAAANALYGEVYGQDYYSGFWSTRFGAEQFAWAWMNLDNYIVPTLGWMYYYNLVGQANQILYGIDDASGDRAALDFIKAQVLTLRCHAYTKLLQLYAPRWQDSNNGEDYCIVLRTIPGEINVPLSKMNEVLDLIYSDLDEAIALYDSSNGKRTYMWEPNKQVAQGIYARAALLKNDWATAKAMAHNARQNYPVMSADEYKAGFNTANAEWMWCNPCDYNGIYYWAFGSVYACNGAYPVGWALGAGAINYELYRQMNTNDIRRDLFWTPDKKLFPGLKKADFWSEKSVNPSNMDCNALNTKMLTSVRAWSRSAAPTDAAAWPPAYADPDKDEAQAYSGIVIQFGAHVKFWGVDTYGTGSFPYMRGAEMLLIEAEAAAMLNEPGTAQACLKELNAKRIEGYTCNATGQDLIDEVRLNRRIELWGEGFNWFDYKRWKLPIERKAWIAGDTESNNIPVADAKTLNVDDRNGWVYSVPRSETQYNTAIDKSLLHKQ